MPLKSRSRLSPVDLSDQEGVYYTGRAPGGEAPALWSYSHETTSNEGQRFWFVDCLSAADAEHPLTVPFTITEVQELLERV